MERFVSKHRSIIHPPLREHKIEDFSPIANNQMGFKLEEPPDGARPLVTKPLNTLLERSLQIWHALSGVESMNETPVNSPKRQIFRKIRHGGSLLQLNETIVGNGMREFIAHMFLCMMLAEVF